MAARGNGRVALLPSLGIHYPLAILPLPPPLQACEHRRELYSRVPGWALDWKNRLKLLVEEVLHHSPDVLCLQEVDCMDDLREALQPTG